jgi:hypothetical protein
MPVAKAPRAPAVSQALELAGLELSYRQRPGCILGEDQVHLGDDNISGAGVTARFLT